MIEIKNEFIKEYIYRNNTQYLIYIKDYNGSYEVYLQNVRYGVISLMFGVEKKNNTIDNLKEIIKNNIDDYIKQYIEDYED